MARFEGDRLAVVRGVVRVASDQTGGGDEGGKGELLHGWGCVYLGEGGRGDKPETSAGYPQVPGFDQFGSAKEPNSTRNR